METPGAPPTPEEEADALYEARHGYQQHPYSCRALHRHALSEPARYDAVLTTNAQVHDYPSSESGIAADCGNSHSHDCRRHNRSDYDHSPASDYSHGHTSDCEHAHARSHSTRRKGHRHRHDDDGAQSLDERCARDLDEILPARLAALNVSRETPAALPWNRSNIAATMERFEPVDYAYAYYDHHMSMPSSSRKTSRQRVRNNHGHKERSTRHAYVTRYGTEENIYEEISEGSRGCPKHRHGPRQSLVSLDRSVVEEEVRRVENRHKRILGELNLSVEAMLMPECESPEGERSEDRDNFEELMRVGPTDELLSPASCNPPDLDSGFSGSSSGASYVGSLRRKPPGSVPHLPAVAYGTKGAGVRILGTNDCTNSGTTRCTRDAHSPRSSSCGDSKTTGFWSRKSWKRIPGFSSSNSLNKAGLTGLLVRYTMRRKPSAQTQGAAMPVGSRRPETACDACLSQRC